MSGEATPALERVLATIDDAALAERYPNRTHFIDATNPAHGTMVTRALLDGDPVALVYPDGRELLFTPEAVKGLAFLMLVFLGMFDWARRRKHANVIQFPVRTRIEARDSTGHPIAA